MISRSLTILETGRITRQSDGLPREFEIAILGPNYLEAVLKVQEMVLGTIEELSFYYPSSRQIFHESLNGKGLIIGCLVEGRLVGFRSIWYPHEHSENLGIDIGMKAPDQLSEVAHLERACVLPDFRGNRLQITMTRHAIELARHNKCFRYIFSTVAPMNYASMQDKFEANMVIVELKKKYESYYRYIFFQYISDPILFPSEPDVPLIYIDGDDIDAQMSLLKNKGAIVGFQQKKNNGITQVGYAKTNHHLF